MNAFLKKWFLNNILELPQNHLTCFQHCKFGFAFWNHNNSKISTWISLTSAQTWEQQKKKQLFLPLHRCHRRAAANLCFPESKKLMKETPKICALEGHSLFGLIVLVSRVRWTFRVFFLDFGQHTILVGLRSDAVEDFVGSLGLGMFTNPCRPR